jgi:hypothetical protein
MTKHRIYATSFASVYPLYVAKAEKRGRMKAEVDQIILWLTGYSQKQFETQLESRKDFEAFFGCASPRSFADSDKGCDMRCPSGRHRGTHNAGDSLSG